jgi:hypothetical protein
MKPVKKRPTKTKAKRSAKKRTLSSRVRKAFDESLKQYDELYRALAK